MAAALFFVAAPLLAEDSAEETFSKGERLFSENDWKGAAKQFRQAAELKKNYWDAYNKWGEALFNQGEIFEAIIKFKEAVQMNPRYTEALYNLGMGYENIHLDNRVKDDEKAVKKLQKTQFMDALAAYAKALAVSPMNDERAVANSHYRTGVLLRDLELKKTEGKPNLKAAMLHLEATLTMVPDYAEARNELGRLYDIIGRYPEAIDQYTKAIAENKYYAQAYSNRGVASWHDGNWDNALADCRQAVEIDPKFAGGHYNLAEVVFARVQEIRAQKDKALTHVEVQKAIDEYKIAVELDPKFMDAWKGLAKSYRAYHDLDLAKETYEHILVLDKRDKEAKQALKEMKAEQKELLKHIPKQYQSSDAGKK
ncbi:MAG: tetratricopeptide repeat protein [candidate division FCPU426 bacterium]